MNKVVIPVYGDILENKEWFVYTYLVSKAWYVDSTTLPIKRGQLQFRSSELDCLMSESTVRNILNCLVNKKLIHKQKFCKWNNTGLLITICDYDSVTNLVLRTNCEQVANTLRTLPNNIVDESCCSEIHVANTLRTHGQSIDNTIHTKLINTVGDDTASPAQTKPKKTRSPSKPKEHTPAHKVWLAYAEAYRTRYGGEAPYRPRNTYMIINTMLEQTNEEELAKRVKFYVEKFNESKVVAAKHPISWLDSRMNEVVEAMNRAQQPAMIIRSF
jgi:hypothetical protein